MIGPILVVAAIGALTIAVIASKKEGEQSGGGGGGKKKGIRDRGLLSQYARQAEGALGWPGLADFLDAVAYTESRWTLTAGPPAVGPTNRATGPYQIRPNSAGDSETMRAQFRNDPKLLQDPAIATAAIVAYFSRNLSRNRDATWGMLRASGAFPAFVHGEPRTPLTKSKSLSWWRIRYGDSIRRFEQALRASGNPQSMVDAIAWRNPRRVNVAWLASKLGANV